ncbi:MAG: FadR/GntR family transcriptional regulator, partial [Anaerolineae bacterium]
SMPIAPLARDTLTDGIIRELQRMIAAGEVKPGGWLPPQPELAQRFGVGLSTVREAIKALALVGLLIPQPGRGTQVSPDAPAILDTSTLVRSRLQELDAIQLCEARQLIEVGLSVMAAQRATTEDIAGIESALQRMEQNLYDDQAFAAADLEFHLAVARAARNRLLERFYQVSRELLAETTQYLVALPQVKEHSIQLQREILNAIKAGDPEAARRSAERHMAYLGQLIAGSRE